MNFKRYNKYMKLHKKLIIVAAAIVVVGGAGTGVAFAMQPNEQPKQEQASIEQPKTVEPKTEVVEEVVEQQPAATQASQAQQQEAPAEPQETIQQEAERLTRAHAAKFQLNADQQWMCMNKMISGDAVGGYGNEAAVREFINVRLQERTNEQGGHTITYFDGVCPTRIKTVYLN